MKKYPIVTSLLCVIVFSCTQHTHYKNNLLEPGKLPSQILTIDITRDTSVITQKGAIIKIPKGSLVSSSNTVQLEIKEAYTIEDIVRGGLTTQSNGQPLSSGGMIYLNPVKGQDVKIAKPIQISTPANYVENKMQLFKGEQQKDGAVNWVDPQPLPPSPQTPMLELGKSLFDANCASCHSIDKYMTGPPLAHILKISPKGWNEGDTTGSSLLYAFTRNNGRVLEAGVDYYVCLYNHWNQTPMNVFPALTDKDLDALYGYIENESERRNLPIPNNHIQDCIDSCKLYIAATRNWKSLKDSLEKESQRIIIKNNSSQIIVPIAPGVAGNETLPDMVIPTSNNTLYYQFTIELWGWHNIDILLKELDQFEDSKLLVELAGAYTTRANIYLIIPSAKVFLQGGTSDVKDNYAFYAKDGNIPLPPDLRAIVLVIGEYNDQIVFGKYEFTTSNQQHFSITPKLVSKETFNSEINALHLQDATIKAADAPNAEELRKAVRELKKAEQLKPRNCDCDCFLNKSQSTPAVMEYQK